MSPANLVELMQFSSINPAVSPFAACATVLLTSLRALNRHDGVPWIIRPFQYAHELTVKHLALRPKNTTTCFYPQKNNGSRLPA